MDWHLGLIEESVAFKFYIRPIEPVTCLVEEGGSKSGGGDQIISH